MGSEGTVVLIVGVDHDDDVGALRKSEGVAGFLVGAVAAILGVNENLETELGCDFGGRVGGAIVD